MSSDYEDIINLPRHESPSRTRMSMAERAAQFSPFAALAGYGDAVKETARSTDKRIELDESEKDALGARLLLAAEHIAERPFVEFTYFRPDPKKRGGTYTTFAGQIKKIDEAERMIVMHDGTRIPIDEVVAIDSRLFDGVYI